MKVRNMFYNIVIYLHGWIGCCIFVLFEREQGVKPNVKLFNDLKLSTSQTGKDATASAKGLNVINKEKFKRCPGRNEK